MIMAIGIVGVTAVIMMAICLMLHYEVLRLLFVHSSKLKHVPRTRVAVVFSVLIAAHLIEIWIFAFGYLLLNGRDSLGHIEGSMTHFLDYVYFSAAVYTLLVFGEYVPVGPLRFFVAMEAFSGLFMITWSAIFIFDMMHGFWAEQLRQRGKPMPSQVHFTTKQAEEIGNKLGIDWTRFDVEQFRKGLNVELEHGRHDPSTDVTGDDPVLTGKIALAHLNEFSDYYTRLEKMEREAKDGRA